MSKQKQMIIRRASIILMCACFCFIYNKAAAQKISTSISKDKIVLGEQVFIKITVDNISAGDVQQDFHFPDTINHIEILSDSIDKPDNTTIVHTLTITSFDSGYWELPVFKLLLNGRRILTTTSLGITVLPVDVSNMQDYHDIKDILEINPENDWWIIAAIVLTGLISLFSVLWFMSNKAPAPTLKKVTGNDLQTLYNNLMLQLKILEGTDASRLLEAKKIFVQSSEAVRSFIDASYNQNTSHLTTGEYIVQLKNKLPNSEDANRYFQFLRVSDAVKFAKYFPPVEETKSIFPILTKMATSVYQQSKTIS